MPNPTPQPIELTKRQQAILEKMSRRQSSSQQLVRRVQIILEMSKGKNNQQVARTLKIHRETVRQWRQRWHGATQRLAQLESSPDERSIMQGIETLLADEPRPGTPAQFSLEQIAAILAIACEPPDHSGYPLSHWTPQAVRAEALKRGILSEISVRQVGRFLKSGCSPTPSSALLAQCRAGRPTGVSSSSKSGL